MLSHALHRVPVFGPMKQPNIMLLSRSQVSPPATLQPAPVTGLHCIAMPVPVVVVAAPVPVVVVEPELLLLEVVVPVPVAVTLPLVPVAPPDPLGFVLQPTANVRTMTD